MPRDFWKFHEMKRGVTERRFWTDCLPRLEHMVMIVLPLRDPGPSEWQTRSEAGR